MPSSRVFYGWWITVAFSIIVFVSAGVRHAVGPFLKPMAADLGVDRGSFSLVIALGLFLYGAFMPWIGGLADRFGARRITAAGSVWLAISLALTADIYDRYSVGSILGVIFLVHQTGAALGSWLAGALFEATGGYGVTLAIACVLLAAAGLVSLRVDREPRRLRWVTRAAGA